MTAVTGPIIFGVNNQGRTNILTSTTDPQSANGIDGDIWIKYV